MIRRLLAALRRLGQDGSTTYWYRGEPISRAEHRHLGGK